VLPQGNLRAWVQEVVLMAYVPYADQVHELHDPHTFLTKYVWSQDHKVIAIQYGSVAILVGLVALGLSLIMRLQLGFPDTFNLIDPSFYYQAVTMHGMIMVIYLLTALFLGGFGNYLIPLMLGARDMVFPFLNMLSFWFYLLSVLILLSSFFVTGGPTGAGWTLYPPQAITAGTPGSEWGILLMLISLGVFIVAFTMGGLNSDAHATVDLGHTGSDHSRSVCIPRSAGQRDHDDL
jgi:cytochrome c oxidase subunit I